MIRPLVFGVDGAYLLPLHAAIESILQVHEHNYDSLRVIVLHEETLDGSLRTAFAGDEVTIEWRPIRLPARMALPVNDWISRAAYVRLAMADALPDVSSCLYLDADIIVRTALDDLLKRPLAEAPVAAVIDLQNPVLRFGDALPGWMQLGLPGNRECFNSGVMVLDLDRCRSLNVFGRALQFIEEFPQHIRYWDQDALNWALDDNWERLELHWNAYPMSAILATPGYTMWAEPVLPLATILAAEDEARILHYAGPAKPWRKSFPLGHAKHAFDAAVVNHLARLGGSCEVCNGYKVEAGTTS